jgi:hypothetical protein
MRMQQLDAGVMQTLNRFAKVGGTSSSNVQDTDLRQGADQPRSQGGQELLANELPPAVEQRAAQTNTLIQPLTWDRAQLEARAGKKTGRSEEYKNIVRILENYSLLMNPLAAPSGLQELIEACEIWLSKNQGQTSAKVQARINAIQELKAAAQQELNILTQVHNAPDPQSAEDSTEFTDEESNSEFEESFNDEKSGSEHANQVGGEEEHDYQKTPAVLDDLGEVIGEEEHSYFKNPKDIPKQKAGHSNSMKESEENVEPDFEDFNEKLEQPLKQAVLPEKVVSQEPEKHGLINKLVAASNRLISKLFKQKKLTRKVSVSTGTEAQVKVPGKAAKSLTQEDYDEILAAIPKTDDDLKEIAKLSKYKSLKKLGGYKEYETSDYYKEFESSSNFTIDKAHKLWARDLDKAEQELESVKRTYPANSKEVKDAEAKVKAERKGLFRITS